MLIRVFAGASLMLVIIWGMTVNWIANQILLPSWYSQSNPPALKTIKKGGAYDEVWLGISSNPLEAFQLPYQNIEFTAEDGKTLRGWFVENAEANHHTIVTAHGGGTDRRGFLRHLPTLFNAGYSVLMFDYREHGASDGSALGVSFGVREHQDILSAVKFAKLELKQNHIAVIGTSLGAASTIIAAAKSDDIEVVIAENPFKSLSSLVTDTKHEGKNPPAFLVTPAAMLTMSRLNGEELPTPLEAVSTLTQPIFFIHGTKDRQVPYQHSEALYAATPSAKELWIAEDATHVHIFNKYPDEYRRRVGRFLAKHFPNNRP